MVESAICPAMRKERTQPRSIPDGYEPAFPLYSSRFDPALTEIAAVFIGAVAKQPNSHLEHDALDEVTNFLQKGAPKPQYTLLCKSEDPTGRETRAWKGYWPSREGYCAWATSSGFQAWWTSSQRETEEHGWILEALYPTMDRYEAVFSNEAAREGGALLSSGMSEPIEEHGYWGSARDRFPVAQIDPLHGESVPDTKTDNGKPHVCPYHHKSSRIVVPGMQNLCVIHSGQDWSAVEGKERSLYLDTLHPSLIEGMKFLSNDKYDELEDEPKREHFGCFECRFMEHLDPDTLEPSLSKSFGLAYVNDLANLEKWSREHPTHLNIFNGFFKYATDTQGKGNLSLWHEVIVLEKEQQYFEYINCPLGTGMLSAIQKPVRDA